MKQAIKIPTTNRPMVSIFLIAGIISSLLYTMMLVFVPLNWQDYSSLSQTVSELSAVDAPTRNLWIVPALMYSVLVILFGWGVIKAGTGNRRLHIAGIFLLFYGIVSLLWPLAPMHRREFLAAWGGTITDTLHLTLAAITVFLMTISIAFSAAALGRSFRLYSVVTILILLLFGILTGMDAPNVKADLPTPWAGLWERINICIFLLWVVALAMVLLKKQQGTNIGNDLV